MKTELDLPPLYRPVILKSGSHAARAEAIRMAVEGGEAGLFLWQPAGDRIDCAIILRPEDQSDAVLPVVLVASMALIDALGAAGPAAVACDLVWPAGVRINGGLAGGVTVDMGPGDPVEWAVLTASLAKTGEEGIEGGERPDVTSLADEGFGEMADADFLQAFARFFLVWMDRWEEGGLDAIAPHWLQRAGSRGAEVVLTVGKEMVAGRIEGIESGGGLVLDVGAGLRTFTLEAGLLVRSPIDL